jgi:hypothetical protein
MGWISLKIVQPELRIVTKSQPRPALRGASLCEL